MAKKKIAVVLAGCGHRDGSEIHEATLTLWAIHKNGADYYCFAPDVNQHHVLNHITGEQMAETRNVLVEAARIARGAIKDIKELEPTAWDGLVFPGGVGVAKNLCDYALAGTGCAVNEDVSRIIKKMVELGKPVGALCIAPVLLAKVLGEVEVTIGHNKATEADLRAMGASHVDTMAGEIAVDRRNKVVTTPCYMLDSRVDQIGEGADRLIKAMLELMD